VDSTSKNSKLAIIKNVDDGSTKFLGFIGESTGYGNVKVGDIVSLISPKGSGTIIKDVVIQDGSKYCLSNYKELGMSKLDGTSWVVVVGSDNLSQPILMTMNDSYTVQDIEVVNLTKLQIEEILGYKINIVG
jgi:hypothetical protein